MDDVIVNKLTFLGRTKENFKWEGEAEVYSKRSLQLLISRSRVQMCTCLLESLPNTLVQPRNVYVSDEMSSFLS